MATTTNYGWETPDDTDLVKDGALAMRDLGQDVDTTLGTALNAKANAGLVLIKKQTVGASVTSVTLTDAFNSNYENYQIVIGGIDGSTTVGNNLRIRFGSTVNEHYCSQYFDGYDAASTGTTRVANGANILIGGVGTSDETSSFVNVRSPFLTKRTTVSGTFNSFYLSGWFGGAVNTTTQYTSFTISVGSGTMTGGTISVYGYGII
jgi:hypothetical protein